MKMYARLLTCFFLVPCLALAAGVRVRILDAPDKDVGYEENAGQGVYTFSSNDCIIGIQNLTERLNRQIVNIQPGENSRIEVGSLKNSSDAPLFSWSGSGGLVIMAGGSQGCIQFYRGIDGSMSTGTLWLVSRRIFLGTPKHTVENDVVIQSGSGIATITMGDATGGYADGAVFGVYSGYNPDKKIGTKAGILAKSGGMSLGNVAWDLVPRGSIVLDSSSSSELAGGECFLKANGPLSLLANNVALNSNSGQGSDAYISNIALEGQDANVNLTLEKDLKIISGAQGCSSGYISSENGSVYISSNKGRVSLLSQGKSSSNAFISTNSKDPTQCVSVDAQRGISIQTQGEGSNLSASIFSSEGSVQLSSKSGSVKITSSSGPYGVCSVYSTGSGGVSVQAGGDLQIGVATVSNIAEASLKSTLGKISVQVGGGVAINNSSNQSGAFITNSSGDIDIQSVGNVSIGISGDVANLCAGIGSSSGLVSVASDSGNVSVLANATGNGLNMAYISSGADSKAPVVDIVARKGTVSVASGYSSINSASIYAVGKAPVNITTQQMSSPTSVGEDFSWQEFLYAQKERFLQAQLDILEQQVAD